MAVSDKMLKAGLTEVAEAGGERILEIAKGLCPVGDTGALKESLEVSVRLYQDNNLALALIGPLADYEVRLPGVGVAIPANYAHLVEFGHRIISHESAQTREWKQAQSQRSSAYKHKTTSRAAEMTLNALSSGFVEANPFMRPAMDAGKQRAFDAMAVRAELVLRRALQAIVKRQEAG